MQVRAPRVFIAQPSPITAARKDFGRTKPRSPRGKTTARLKNRRRGSVREESASAKLAALLATVFGELEHRGTRGDAHRRTQAHHRRLS